MARKKKADGWYHGVITVGIAFILLGVPLVLGDTKWFWLSAGALTGLFINPDLDQNGLSAAETTFMKLPTPILKGFGITLMGLWIAVWGYYAAFIPHRSPLSHWPVLGTALRVAYLLGVVWLIGLAFNSSDLTQSIIGSEAVRIATIGLAFADLGHWLRDVGVLVFEEERV